MMTSTNLTEQLLGSSALAAHGDRVALLPVEGEPVRYAELAQLTASFATGLAAQGVGEGDRVVLMSDDSVATIAAFLGAMALGAIPAPVGTRTGPDKLRSILDIAEPKLIVTEPGLAAPAEHESIEIPKLAIPDITALAPVSRQATDPAFLLFTSGTTGAPTAVLHGHRPLAEAARFHREWLGLEPGQIIWCSSKLSFAYAMGNGLLGPLANGLASVIDPTWPDEVRAAAALERFRPSAFFSVPTFYRRLLRAGKASAARDVARFVSAGEHLPPDLSVHWREEVGVPILDGYGASETVFLMLAQAPGDPAGPLHALHGVVPELTALDAAAGEAQLRVRAPFQALGYYRRPELTAARFADGLYDTGDIVRPEGEGFRHLGRGDSWHKVAGQWVNLLDLESAAMSVAEVVEAAASVVEDSDGMRRVALAVTGGEGLGVRPPDPDKIREALEARLAPHERPRWITTFEAMPRTDTGKLDRATVQTKLNEAAGLQPGR